MKIDELVWPEDRIEHIARHGVLPEEVEEVCTSRPRIFQTKSQGKNPAYEIFGQTAEGRHLFCVVILFPDGKGYPVTARLMTDRERHRYNQWKKR